METGDPNVPKDWIIEFSDVIFGNRWEKDEIRLEVAGRTCPDITTSYHDRRSDFKISNHNFVQSNSFI